MKLEELMMLKVSIMSIRHKRVIKTIIIANRLATVVHTDIIIVMLERLVLDVGNQ
jgi:ABC-type transport system involved in Fe-S cluster assembly fused permease/ATPase subunit